MERNFLKTSDEETAFEFGRLMDLFARAFSATADCACICQRVNEGGASGLDWITALEQALASHVIPTPPSGEEATLQNFGEAA